MANVNIPYPETGLAAFEALDSHTAGILLSGSDPKLEPGFPMEIAVGQALKMFEVVGLDAGGKLVPAVYDADPQDPAFVQAIGVCTQAVAAPTGTGVTVPIWFAGCFNPDALVWDATFATDDSKANAFFGAPSPTRILIRKRG